MKIELTQDEVAEIARQISEQVVHNIRARAGEMEETKLLARLDPKKMGAALCVLIYLQETRLNRRQDELGEYVEILNSDLQEKLHLSTLDLKDAREKLVAERHITVSRETFHRGPLYIRYRIRNGA